MARLRTFRGLPVATFTPKIFSNLLPFVDRRLRILQSCVLRGFRECIEVADKISHIRVVCVGLKSKLMLDRDGESMDEANRGAAREASII